MIIYDFEVFKHDWLVCWIDTDTKKMYSLHNDAERFKKFYDYYKDVIWVGYNSRTYDQWVAKAILAGFDPWEMNDWIINKDRRGFEFSRLLNNFPILNYDCSVGFRSLKELEAFMGHDIQEADVPWDLDRPLTPAELKSIIQYCKHDVWETFEVFVEQKDEFESHMGLIKEFDLPMKYVNKTKAQLSAIILGASRVERRDEFEISIPSVADLGKYSFIKDFYLDWAKNSKSYETMSLETAVCGVPHKFGIGGIHGAKDKYMGDGIYMMADVSSFYPAIMIEYNFLSRNVIHPEKFKTIRDERLIMKASGDPKEKPRKIVINATFGASKDKYNALYDPRQANNTCIAGQIFIVDLLEKLEGKCELIQSNTDGILIKVYRESDIPEIKRICKEWSDRTKFMLDFDEISRVIQRDVNNYIVIFKNGKIKRKGSVVKKLSKLDNNKPIINDAVVNYLINGTPVEETVRRCDDLIKFQIVTKIGGMYEYASHNDKKLNGKVNRVFASLDRNDTTLYKKHHKKTTLDKVAGTPENCFVLNSNITETDIPEKLDREWYIQEAKRAIENFI